MTMFTRNDKPTESNATFLASQSVRDRVEVPVQVPTPTLVPEPHEPKRPMASAHPLQSIVSPAPRASVISKAMKITGQLESTEDIQIDGEVDGDVRALSVKVGSNAKVKGAVYGDEVEVAGTVEGKIEAKKVVLTSTAHMSGDIVHQEIAIHSGAFIDGHCKPDYGKTGSRNVISVRKPAAAE
jgi:cytoskeletal protein CcmA (bactofilin family)